MVRSQVIRVIPAPFLGFDCGFLILHDFRVPRLCFPSLWATNTVLRLHNLYGDETISFFRVANALHEAIFDLFERHVLVALASLLCKQALDEAFRVHFCRFFSRKVLVVEEFPSLIISQGARHLLSQVGRKVGL